MLLIGFDLGDERRHGHLASRRDFLQGAPELVFKANTGPAAGNDHRMFYDRRFHYRTLMARRVRLTRRVWDGQLTVFQHRLIAVERRVDAGLIPARFPALGMHRLISLALLVRVG